MSDPGATVVTMIARHCARVPSAVAARLPDGARVSYADLDRRAGEITAYLRPLVQAAGGTAVSTAGADGAGRPVVAIDLPAGLDFCAAVLAVLASGAALLAVDRSLPAARTAAMLAAAGPLLVLSDRGNAEAESAPAVAPPPPGGAVAPDWREHRDDPLAPAYMIFTSGSTGTPKATLNTHAGLASHLRFMQDTCPLPPGGGVLLKSRRSFDAWLLEFFWPLTQGGTLVVADEERAGDARYLAARLAGDQVHGLVAVPSLLRRILAVLPAGAADSLRYVISAGEPLTAALANRILAATPAVLFNFYGPAEAAIDVAYCRLGPAPVTDPVPVGRPIPGSRLLVTGPDGADITGTGERGELVVCGTHVGLGYAGDPRATAERFGTRDGERCYATGDVAFLGPDQNFYLGGRMDSQVKINGVRIETGEIEARLLEHPTVADCTVQVTTSGGVPVLVAFIQARGDAADKGEYISYLRRCLPPVMVPAAYVFLTEFSYLPSGKKDASRLEFPRGLPTVTAADFEAPEGDTEAALSRIWEAALGVAPIGAADDFSLVGGDSLKMIDILVKISESVYPDVFGLAITRFSTVRELAASIDKAQAR